MIEPSSPLIKKPNGTLWTIYLSRALSAWGDRMWSFGAGLFMVALDPSDSLRLVAVSGFLTCLSVILLGAAIGTWIDHRPRLLAAKVFLTVQNLSVALSCAILGFYFWDEMEETFDSWVPWVVSVVVILIGTLANLASVGSKIVVEKDWIVVIAGGDNNKLAQMNSVFRTLDLSCLILAPILAGMLFDYVSYSFTALFIAGWNLVSVCLEYALLVKIYRQHPELSKKVSQSRQGEEEEPGSNMGNRLRSTVLSWKMYYDHPVRNAGFGLACLYMTVLGFDNITYGYCQKQCVRESVLGGLVGISAIIGVTASLTFPFLRRAINVARTGVVGFTSLVLVLSFCVASIWLPGSPFKYYHGGSGNSFNSSLENNSTAGGDAEDDCYVDSQISVWTLLVGIIAARFGLWLSDLSVTQILQENVEESFRGTIGGVQGGLNSTMDLIKFTLVIIWPNSETFGWLILASYAFICLGMLSYTSYAVRNWKSTPSNSKGGETLSPEAASQPTSPVEKGKEGEDVGGISGGRTNYGLQASSEMNENQTRNEIEANVSSADTCSSSENEDISEKV